MTAKPHSTSESVSVAIVEDDARVRHSLATMLGQAPGCTCAGEYASGEEAVAGLACHPASVVVVDVNLPGMNGVECVRQLTGILPKAQMMMLTVHDDTETLFQALQAGASGYLLKPVRVKEFIAAVQDVIAGGAPMTGCMARKVVQTFRQRPVPKDEALSPRESEILDLLAKGHAYKEIADLLQIGYRTVHTHIERIYKKLRVQSRGQAVARHLSR